jgi:hypothetical protein
MAVRHGLGLGLTLTNGPAAGLGSRDPRPALTEPGSLWPPTPDPPQTPSARTSGGFTRLREKHSRVCITI